MQAALDMNGLDLLRWVLLIVGVAILVAVYFAGRRSVGARLRRRRARAELPEIDSEADSGSLSVPDPELAELGRSIAIEERAGMHSRPEHNPSIKAERPPNRAQPRGSASSEAKSQGPKPQGSKPEPKIVMVYVVARSGLSFRGPDIFDAARDAGLEYGDMRIFHHYEALGGEPQSVFSLANMVEPGWFDDEQKGQLQSPGLVLFLQLPGPMEGTKAFDAMIAAAQTLKRNLGGELHDASRSVMGQQTIAHLRDEISEYERRQRTRSGVR